MRHTKTVALYVVLAAFVGCSAESIESNSNGPGNNSVVTDGQPGDTPNGPAPPPVDPIVKQAIRDYWDRCIIVNRNYVQDKQELWFGEFRPAAVGKNCRDAAATLRELDKTDVDPVVIDHVNRVIRGFESIAAIAETKGQQSLLQDTADVIKFIAIIASQRKGPGFVADSGSLAIGTGIFENGQKTSEAGHRQTTSIAVQLMESEEQAIQNVRNKYGVELHAW